MPIDNLFTLTNKQVIGNFNMPVEPSEADIEWYNEVMGNRDTPWQERVSQVKERFPPTGQIVQYEIGQLGLPVMLFLDDQGQPLEKFRELLLYHQTGPDSGTRVRIQDLDEGHAESIGYYIKYAQKWAEKLITDDIRPSVTQLGDIKIETCKQNRFSGSRVMEANDQSHEITYHITVNDSLNVTKFGYTIRSKPTEEPEGRDILFDITVEQAKSGHYLYSAEIRGINSLNLALDRPEGKQVPWYNYKFGEDGRLKTFSAISSAVSGGNDLSIDEYLKYRNFIASDQAKVCFTDDEPVPELLLCALLLCRRRANIFEDGYATFKAYSGINPVDCKIDYQQAIKGLAGFMRGQTAYPMMLSDAPSEITPDQRRLLESIQH